MPVTPLCRKNLHYPWWIFLIPYGKQSFEKKVFSQILNSRTTVEVQKRWESTGVHINDVSTISEIIAQECGWPNSHFIPEDECSVILHSGTLGLDDVSATLQIENRLGEGIELPEEVWDHTYGDLLRAVV